MVVTGQFVDELGSNLTNRNIRVSYEMQGGTQGVISCQPATTDMDGMLSHLSTRGRDGWTGPCYR